MRGSVKLLRTRRARSFPHGKRKFMIGVFLSGRIPTTNIATAIKSAGTRLSLLTAISLARPPSRVARSSTTTLLRKGNNGDLRAKARQLPSCRPTVGANLLALYATTLPRRPTTIWTTSQLVHRAKTMILYPTLFDLPGLARRYRAPVALAMSRSHPSFALSRCTFAVARECDPTVTFVLIVHSRSSGQL